ncbi:MAG: hypothetical protein M5U34_00135 [Chloroflexi bacterium]|nr:hypothetical protein [Chloroflexota bacterium]
MSRWLPAIYPGNGRSPHRISPSTLEPTVTGTAVAPNTLEPTSTGTGTAVSPTSTATPSIPPTPPVHRLAIHQIGESPAEFFDRQTGEPFIPRGVNYVYVPHNGSMSNLPSKSASTIQSAPAPTFKH